MIKFVQLKKGVAPTNFDYVFEKYDEYEKMSDYFRYPKIEGNWRLDFVDIPIQRVREMLLVEWPKFVEMTFYLKADVMESLQQEYPKLFTETKSKWELYMDLISEFPKQIEKKASSELFRRAKGDTEKLKELLDYFVKEYPEDDIITYKHVSGSILPDNTVYARDVVLHLLLKDNSLVPRKGSILSKYRFKNWTDALDDLISVVGEDVAYYSIRKYINNLYNNKHRYLNSSDRDIKDRDVLAVVDIYQIIHARLSFLDSNPRQLFAILKIIEGRSKDASLILRTSITNGRKYDDTK